MKKYLPGGILIIVLLIMAGILLRPGSPEPVAAPRIEPEPIEAAMPNPYVEKLLDEYSREITELFDKTRTPALALAIVQDSTVLMMKTLGVREVGTTDTIDENTVFRLASVSKTFAPLLTGILVEDGILQWDDRVVDHLPDFSLKAKANTDSLRLTHVLSHTTGLPYHTYTTLVEDGLDLPTMLDELRNIDLIAPPGEIYSYQNVAYSLIAAVIRRRTGRSYADLMEERVFRPLGMRDASMSYDAIINNENVAQPHLHWARGWHKTRISDTYYNVGPAGGVNASISDMAQWLKGILGNPALVSDSTLDKIFSPAVKARTRNRYFRKWIGRSDAHYALGWRVLQFENDTLLYHGGYVRGYRSEVAIDRRSKIGICVLTNGPGRLIDNSVPMFFNLYYNYRDSILYWQNHRDVLANQIDFAVYDKPTAPYEVRPKK